MKELLNAIRAELGSRCSAVRERDIYITEDIRLLRNSGDYPSIALKDGGVDFVVESSVQQRESLSIDIAVYVRLRKMEAGIMGDPSTGSLGVLDMAKTVISILGDNTLGEMVDVAVPVSMGESETLATDNMFIQMLPVTMRYEKYF